MVCEIWLGIQDGSGVAPCVTLHMGRPRCEPLGWGGSTRVWGMGGTVGLAANSGQFGSPGHGHTGRNLGG